MKINTTLKFIILISTLIVSLLLLNKTVEAYRGPVINEFFVEIDGANPGDTITRSYKVTNDYAPNEDGTDVSVTFDIEVVNFTQRQVDGGIEFIEENELPSDLRMSDWITVEPSTFTLENHGQSQEVTYTINVPEDAEGGGRYAALMLRPSVNNAGTGVDGSLPVPTGANSGINSQLSTLVFLTVNGDIELNLELTDFHVETLDEKVQKTFWGGPVKAVATFTNTGNVHLAPRGVIFFHKGDAIEARVNPELSTQINEDLLYVLPGASRSYEIIWNPESFVYTEAKEIRGDETITLREGDPGFMDYEVKDIEYSTKYDLNKLGNILFGEYKVSVQYAADNDTDFTDEVSGESTVTFFFLPVPLIIALLVPVLLIIVLVIVMKVRKRKKKVKTEVNSTSINNNVQTNI